MIDSILNETESSIDRQWRDMEFCYEVMEQHREMEKFVNECLIMASGNKKAINEMYILNEGTVGDKIKGFFTKIKNFFKKIFDKLGASLNGVFMEQKKYIDKYAYIITKCKWMQGDVSDVKDRFKGLPRIVDAVDNAETAIIGNNMDKFFKGEKAGADFIDINTFQSAESINAAYNKEELKKKLETGATRDETYNNFIGEGSYWSKIQDFGSYKETDSNGNVDISATFMAWFDGSKDTVSWSGDEVDTNFQTVINTTYAGQSYLSKLEKIVTSVTKKMDEAARVMENYHKAQQDKVLQAVKGNATEQKPEEVEKNKKEEQKASEEVDKAKKATMPDIADSKSKKTNTTMPSLGESVNINKKYSFPLNEINFGGGNSSSSSSDSTVKGPTGAGVNQVNSASKANENINKAQVNNMKANHLNNTTGITNDNKSEIEKKAQELLDVDIYNRQVKINESINISSTIVRKMFDSFKNTNTDFFKIIQAHVQWYLSNPGEEKKPENQTTRVRNLNMNAGGETVSKEQPAKTEEKTKKTDYSDIDVEKLKEILNSNEPDKL